MKRSRFVAMLPTLAGIGLVILAAARVHAEEEEPPETLDFREQLSATRPEAWAMRYFGAATQSTGISAPVSRRLGALELGLEFGNIPHLSVEQRTVGFNGTKTEDLNRVPVIARPHAALGIGGGFSLVADWVPPLEIDDVKADVVTVALERPFFISDTWSLGGRLGAGSGRIEGDITCPRAAVAAGDDPVRNPYECNAPSHDKQQYHWKTAGLTVGRTLTPNLSAHASASVWRLNGVFRVNADYEEYDDYTRLAYEGNDWGGALGLDWARSGGSWRFGGEVFYSPLDVTRNIDGRPTRRHDDFWNVRVLASYRLARRPDTPTAPGR